MERELLYLRLVLAQMVHITLETYLCCNNTNAFLILCDALQQNRVQVAQAYFEIWTIEVA